MTKKDESDEKPRGRSSTPAPSGPSYQDACETVEALALGYRAGGDTPRASALEHALRLLKEKTV